MARQFRETGITFLDGFAGPGEYTNASESSPAIAMAQAMRDDVTRWGTPTRLIFIEYNRRRCAHLRTQLDARFPLSGRPPGLTTLVRNGKCADLYQAAIADVCGWSGPVFANLNGWGADTDHEIVRRIAQQPSSEVLVTVQDHFFVRFSVVTPCSKRSTRKRTRRRRRTREWKRGQQRRSAQAGRTNNVSSAAQSGAGGNAPAGPPRIDNPALDV